ncbi:MAG TPA: hypothetical protein VGA09_18170 [Candidatus Binatia bacterium]
MDGKAIVQSIIEEIIQPGVQRLMDSRYFTELRQGKLSTRRLQGLGDPALSPQQSDSQIVCAWYG